MSSIMNPPSRGLGGWEDLDLDALKNTFKRVPLKDLFLNIPWVCRSWQLACWESLFWSDPKTLDLTSFSDALGPPPHLSESTEGITEKQMKILERILRNIMGGNYDANGFPLERWRQSINKIVIPHSLLISDKLLLFIAERTPGVETLMLFGLQNITILGGLARAIGYWKNVTHFAAGRCYPHEWFKYTELLTVMGKGWPQLTTLEVHAHNFQFGPSEARLIAKNLPKLTTLRFEKSRVLKEGVWYMLDSAFQDRYMAGLEFDNGSCPQLEVIQFRNCRLPFGLRGLVPRDYESYSLEYTSISGEGEDWEREQEDPKRKGQDWAKDWVGFWEGYVISRSPCT